MPANVTKRDWETYVYGLTDCPEGIKPANFKAVALAFGYHADWKTLENMSASMVTIARETGIHRNTVDKVVAAMVAQGMATRRDEKRSWGTKTGKWTYAYDLLIPELTDSQIDVSPLASNGTDSHSQVTDSHSQVTDSQINVNNHTYSHTYNHIDESALASQAATHSRLEDSQSKEDAPSLGSTSVRDAFGIEKTNAAPACETVFKHCVDCGVLLKGAYNMVTKRCMDCDFAFKDAEEEARRKHSEQDYTLRMEEAHAEARARMKGVA